MLAYSAAVSLGVINQFNIENISILSAVLHHGSATKTLETPTLADIQPSNTDHCDSLKVLPAKNFSNYKMPRHITAFYSDTDKASLPALMHKLYVLKQKKAGKVRIAWLGDSMIEGDLLTQTVRKLLQQYFGGSGVGFVPATSVVAGFRSTVSHKWTGDWKEENFRTSDNKAPLYLSGHTFFTNNGDLEMKDATLHDTATVLEKSLICGKSNSDITVGVNGHQEHFRTYKEINRLVLDNSDTHGIAVAVQDAGLPVYGISFESKEGVIVDNYSFRGVSGLELGKLDTAVLADMDSDRTYDLVVLQYGANILYKPDDTDYSWYEKHIIQVVHRLQKLMPHSEFLVISSADRAFRYGDTWQTAIGIQNLIRSQAELAYVDNTSFYNMYTSMGGSGTIVSWADGTPQLANKDYIHPNLKGAERLGNMFFEAFMNDYYKANKINVAAN